MWEHQAANLIEDEGLNRWTERAKAAVADSSKVEARSKRMGAKRQKEMDRAEIEKGRNKTDRKSQTVRKGQKETG